MSEVCEKMRVTCKPRAQFKHRNYFFCRTPNFARIVTLFEKIYDEQPILTIISNIGEDVHCTIPLFQLSAWCEKCVAARYTFPLFGTIIDFKWQKQGSLSSFGPLRGWDLHRFLWKSPHSTHLFLIGQYLKNNLIFYSDIGARMKVDEKQCKEYIWRHHFPGFLAVPSKPVFSGGFFLRHSPPGTPPYNFTTLQPHKPFTTCTLFMKSQPHELLI